MKLDQVFKILKEREARSLKEGYRGDAASYASKRFILMFLSEIAQGKKRKKRKPSAWNLFVGEYMRQGKGVKEASRDWNKKKK